MFVHQSARFEYLSILERHVLSLTVRRCYCLLGVGSRPRAHGPRGPRGGRGRGAAMRGAIARGMPQAVMQPMTPPMAPNSLPASMTLGAMANSSIGVGTSGSNLPNVSNANHPAVEERGNDAWNKWVLNASQPLMLYIVSSKSQIHTPFSLTLHCPRRFPFSTADDPRCFLPLLFLFLLFLLHVFVSSTAEDEVGWSAASTGRRRADAVLQSLSTSGGFNSLRSKGWSVCGVCEKGEIDAPYAFSKLCVHCTGS